MENKDCPCKRKQCERHGNCDECKAHHKQVMKYPCACERKKKNKKDSRPD